VRHPGQHQPIIDLELWDQVQRQLHEHAKRRRLRAVKVDPSPLAGKLFDPSGAGLTPSHARKGERRYRYYISRGLTIGPAHRVRNGWRLPAPEIERTVAAAAQQLLTDEPAIAAAVEDAGVAANRIPRSWRRPAHGAASCGRAAKLWRRSRPWCIASSSAATDSASPSRCRCRRQLGTIRRGPTRSSRASFRCSLSGAAWSCGW
jgi:hypothetical protein